MHKKHKTFYQRAKSWAATQKLIGHSAFSRFVMMTFVDRLNQITDEFVFKGGNLLWVYIRTPRATIDLDMVTRTINDHEVVRELLNEACKKRSDEISFSVVDFTPMERDGTRAAGAIIAYKTNENQANTFEVDIVYDIPTVSTWIPSPVGDGHEIAAVTIENIIADKLSACQKFGSGNTRMKDFDDLWRISKTGLPGIDWQELKKILGNRKIASQLDPAWVTKNMIQSWRNHFRRNLGLPEDLTLLINEVNAWLKLGWK